MVGRFFERLVGLMKRGLKKTIGQAKMSYDELSTLIIEVEAVLNSRPLTYVSTEDTTEPLAPSHGLMTGRRLLTLPKIGTCVCSEDSDFLPGSSQPLCKRLTLNKTIDHFWTRWRREYLVAFRDSHQHRKSSCSDATVNVGEVCVLFDSKCPRTFWRLAKIEHLISGQDGKVCGMVIRTVTKSGNVSVLRRPIQHLYPLELHDTQSPNDMQSPDDTHSQDDTHSPDDMHSLDMQSQDNLPIPTRRPTQTATRPQERLQILHEEIA